MWVARRQGVCERIAGRNGSGWGKGIREGEGEERVEGEGEEIVGGEFEGEGGSGQREEKDERTGWDGGTGKGTEEGRGRDIRSLSGLG